MGREELSTVLITPEHIIRAEVPSGGRRLLDVVNDRTTDFLRVHDVAVHRRECGALVAEAPSAVMRKANIAMLGPATGQREAAQKRCDNYVAKRGVETLLVVLGYEVFGRLYLKGTDDPVSVFTNELVGFFPVPEAEVYVGRTGDTLGAPSVVIVNSAFVSFCRIGEYARPSAQGSASVSVEATLSSAIAPATFAE